MVEHDLPFSRIQRAGRGIAISQVTMPLLDAFRRLIDLLDQPEDIPILAPLIQREILMLTEHLDAATVSFQVGYESHSQFSGSTVVCLGFRHHTILKG